MLFLPFLGLYFYVNHPSTNLLIHVLLVKAPKKSQHINKESLNTLDSWGYDEQNL